MELPFHLKTLEPLKGALDILRFFDQTDGNTADAEVIMQTLDLSERAFGRAIRRLITKGYVQADGDMIYRLTDQGQTAVRELADYDEESGDSVAPVSDAAKRIRSVTRRLFIVTPEALVASMPTTLYVGFHDASEDNTLDETCEVVVRVAVINGEPETPEDLLFTLENTHVAQSLTIVPGGFKQMRLRLNAYQLGELGDIDPAGGFYIDLPVKPDGAAAEPVAFGSTIDLQG
ncbi:MAG: hypothetical protein ACOCX5_02110 [Chloroflexota bacterium]